MKKRFAFLGQNALYAAAIFVGLCLMSSREVSAMGKGQKPAASLADCFGGDDGDLQYPNLMSIVPHHVKLSTSKQGGQAVHQEFLEFATGLSNMGDGPWWIIPSPEAPEIDPETGDATYQAYQLIVNQSQYQDSDYTVESGFLPANLAELEASASSRSPYYTVACPAAKMEFHAEHNHIHVDDVAEFKVCTRADFDSAGPACPAESNAQGESISFKQTFCLVDWTRLGHSGNGYAQGSSSGNGASDPILTRPTNFVDCEVAAQGVSPLWTDQYSAETAGQSVDVTGLAPGPYVLVATANPVGTFDEIEGQDYNSSWVYFYLVRGESTDSKGNAGIAITGDACNTDVVADVDARVDNHLAELNAAVSRFVADPNDPAYQLILDDLCSVKTSNK